MRPLEASLRVRQVVGVLVGQGAVPLLLLLVHHRVEGHHVLLLRDHAVVVRPVAADRGRHVVQGRRSGEDAVDVGVVDEAGLVLRVREMLLLLLLLLLVAAVAVVVVVVVVVSRGIGE